VHFIFVIPLSAVVTY